VSRRLILLAALAVAPALPGAPAWSQGLLNRGSGPIAIDADDGIEWRREEKVYIATGHAKATRGDITVSAHRLIAYYRERDPARVATAAPQPQGEGTATTDIYRIVAETDVVVATPTQTVRAITASMTSIARAGADRKNLALDTSQDHITARDSLEYWRSARSRSRAATAS